MDFCLSAGSTGKNKSDERQLFRFLEVSINSINEWANIDVPSYSSLLRFSSMERGGNGCDDDTFGRAGW